MGRGDIRGGRFVIVRPCPAVGGRDGEKEPDTFYRGPQLWLAPGGGVAFAATAIRAGSSPRQNRPAEQMVARDPPLSLSPSLSRREAAEHLSFSLSPLSSDRTVRPVGDEMKGEEEEEEEEGGVRLRKWEMTIRLSGELRCRLALGVLRHLRPRIYTSGPLSRGLVAAAFLTLKHTVKHTWSARSV